MRKLFETYELTITPLTPIHIGSGDEINPGDYFIFEDEQGWPVLYAIDIGYLGSKLINPKGREVLCQWIEQEPVSWVRKLEKNIDLVKLVKRYVNFTSDVSKRVVVEIRSRWGAANSRLGVQTLQRPGMHAIIPGSSIKGALRTALLWSMSDKPLDPIPGIRDVEVTGWERLSLGSRSRNIQDDLLRHLKITDAEATGTSTMILDAVHVGMRSGNDDEAGLQDYRECLPDTLSGHPVYDIRTTLTIETGHPHYKQSRGTLSADRILECCRDFYSKVINEERDYWDRDAKIRALYDEIQDRLSADPKSAPIRLGWGCGLNTIGLNLAKENGPQPRWGTNPHYYKETITRILLDEFYPPGWAMISLRER